MKSSRYLFNFIPKALWRLIQSGLIPGVIIFTGCQDFLPAIPPETASLQHTAIVLPTIIPSESPTPYLPDARTATPTLKVCNELQGSIVSDEIPSSVLGETIRTKVYLPPCYDRFDSDNYPFIVMLHGQNGKDDQWIELGMTGSADQLISSGKAAPFLIFMPFERLFLIDADQSHYVEALVQDFLPGIYELYRLKDGRDNRAIGGLSRGANWAVRIGLTEWQAFGKIGAHSYTTFVGDINQLPGWLDTLPVGEIPKIAFDIGKDDSYFKYSDSFVRRLQDSGVPVSYQINEGGHTNNYWSSHALDYLNWYIQDWPIPEKP